jgi:tetratricopeptide (TPR) repeat protein
MKLKNLIFFPAFLFFLWQNLAAQNINGLKIYVSKLYATTLYFHDAYSKYGFGETTCPYKFNSLLGDEKSIALEVPNTVAAPYTLYVTEGGRKHKFIILYKENLEDSERDIYFTDLDKVAQLSKTANSEPISQASKTDISKSESPETETAKVETPIVKNTSIDSAEINDIKYAGLVTKANSAFSSNNFNDALKYYTAALALKPDDIYLNSQVEIIQKKMNEARIAEDMRRKDSSFQSYINAGDKLLNDKSNNAAKIAYQEALKLKPDNAIALQRLQSVDQNIVADSLKAQQQKKEDLYVKYLSLGDTAMIKKSYEPAKVAYEQALQIKPDDAAAKERLRSLNANISKDSLDAVNQKNTALYTTYISMADNAFGEKSFDKARYSYDSALIIKPGDTYANNQINKIDNILAEQQNQAQKELALQKSQALQKQYNDLISEADKKYNSELYDEALADYEKALEINRNDQYSKNKITQIKNLLNDKRSKQKQDSINDVKYVAIIKKADNAFTLNDYTNARLFYESALTYRNKDNYAINKIAEIEHTLAEAAEKKQAEKDSLNKIIETNKNYIKLIEDGKKAYDEKDYTLARIKYSEANDLKPNETEAKNKLIIIDSELAEIANKQVLQNESDSLITSGEIAIATQQFPLALDNFKAAMMLNLSEQQYYLQRQVNYIQDQLNILEHVRQTEELKRNFDSAMSAYKQGKAALQYHDYDGILFYFKKYLNIVGNMDSATLEQSQYNLTNITKYVKTEVANIEDYLTRQNVAVTNKDTTHVKSSIAYASYALTIYYPNPKDPSINYVYKKYPDLDFYSSPPNQHFDSLLNFNVQSNLIGREIMSFKPDLEITDSINGVKLICQNIIFKNNNLYFKFLVQNYNSLEFLTGRMLLSYKPNNKDSVKLYPNYISSYPIILGGRQKVIVYVTKPITISDEENLRFEMVDRLNKQTLAIVIPGSVYNKKQKN